MPPGKQSTLFADHLASSSSVLRNNFRVNVNFQSIQKMLTKRTPNLPIITLKGDHPLEILDCLYGDIDNHNPLIKFQ